jgi:sugar diacid utilization regulator
MPNWEHRRKQLMQVLQAEVEWVHLDGVPFASLRDPIAPHSMGWEREGTVYYPLEPTESGWKAFAIPEINLSRAERELISLFLYEKEPIHTEDEPSEGSFSWGPPMKDWILREDSDSQVPDCLKALQALYSDSEKVIPILLASHGEHSISAVYKDASELFQSFYERETVLIPLSANEWLLLLDSELLTENTEELVIQAMESLGEVLHEVIISELAEHLNIVLNTPVNWTGLPAAYRKLSLQLRIGKTYLPDQSVYTPKGLMVEQMLESLDPSMKAAWISLLPNLFEAFKDTEMRQTIRHFFENDAKLTETAKVLYIHRNTLLYRLDKFKQETGWDIRKFSHAMLVKLALMMYISSTK